MWTRDTLGDRERLSIFGVAFISRLFSNRARQLCRSTLFMAGATIIFFNGATAHEQAPATPMPSADERKAAITPHLRHIYSVYICIRACTEMAAREGDGSFRPDVSLDEARKALKAIDAATSEVGIDSTVVWKDVAPMATVTAESLKQDPTANVKYCAVLGALFRTDAANLQYNLTALGAKTPLIPKDY